MATFSIFLNKKLTYNIALRFFSNAFRIYMIILVILDVRGTNWLHFLSFFFSPLPFPPPLFPPRREDLAQSPAKLLQNLEQLEFGTI